MGGNAFLQAGAAPASNMAAMAAAAAAGLFGGVPAGMQHGLGSLGGFEQTLSGQHALTSAEGLLQQQQSLSGSEGVGGGASAGVSGSGFAGLPGIVSGLTSSEAVYGTDGMDVPGTAQVRLLALGLLFDWSYLKCFGVAAVTQSVLFVGRMAGRQAWLYMAVRV
jgi:hypothetical protein